MVEAGEEEREFYYTETKMSTYVGFKHTRSVMISLRDDVESDKKKMGLFSWVGVVGISGMKKRICFSGYGMD